MKFGQGLKGLSIGLLALALFSAPVVANASGVTVYKNGDKYVKIGGRIQMQYHSVDKSGSASTTDTLAFRRFRPFIEGSVHKDWTGKFQWDMGEASGDNEIAIKDAYMRYTGFNNIAVTVGNANFAFSRELLTSSKYQQLVERTFVGDHNYGTPDRQLGLHIAGHNGDKKLTWGVAATSADIDPDKNKLDFDTSVNKGTDFNQGWMVGGRVDYHPFGHMKFSQGNFDPSNMKATIGVAAFTWSNDDDNNTYLTTGTKTNALGSAGSKYDVDKVTGLEVSAAYRYMGVSVDAQYNKFDADTVDSTVTGGIYKNGNSNLSNYSIEGGYMVIPSKLELVAGYQVQDADNYATEWTRSSFGANYFFNKHDAKLQATYRSGKDIKGVNGSDEDEIFVQAQYVF